MKQMLFIIGIVFLFSISIVYATSSTFNMYWNVPVVWDENGTLLLNFSLTNVGNQSPNNICFALNNTAVCVDDEARDLDLEGLGIINTSFLTDENGNNFTLLQLNQSGGDVTNYTLINETIIALIQNLTTNGSYYDDAWINITIDEKITNYNTTLWGEITSYINTIILSIGNWSADKLNYLNATEINETIPILMENTTIARIGDCPLGYVAQNTTTGGVECLSLETEYFNVSSWDTTIGTSEGGLQELNVYDDITFNITENTLSGLEFRVNFTGITAFNQLIFRYRSTVGENHIVKVQLYDYDTSTWENYATLGEVVDYDIKTIGVYDMDEHISSGVVQIRFYQDSNGNPSHIHYFDWINIANGFATPSGAEIDPFSIHTDKINLTQFFYDGILQLNITWLNSLIDTKILEFNSTLALGGSDNLGNHNATQNLSINSYYIWLSGNETTDGSSFMYAENGITYHGVIVT